jgi:hypothetical protein
MVMVVVARITSITATARPEADRQAGSNRLNATSTITMVIPSQ